MRRRLFTVGVHLSLSLLVGGLAAVVVFVVWYPPPYAAIAGGLSLFVLLVSVDVILGPALTAVVSSPAKPRPELYRDLSVIALVQVAAFGYGMHAIAAARPVYLAFEIDRFRVVSAVDIEPETLQDAPAELRSLPWDGPRLIAAVKPTDPAEQVRSIELGLAGFDLSMVPKNWRAYAPYADNVWSAARPVQALLAKYPQHADAARKAAKDAGTELATLRFLPLMSRRVSGSALIANPGARIVGYVPVDGFF